MPNFVVSTAFGAKDRGISGFLRNLTRQVSTFGNKADKSFKKASKGALSFKSVVGGIVTAGALNKAFGLATEGVRTLTAEFVSFDHAITAASAKFPEKIKRGTKEFRELEKAARDVGARTQFTATQAGEGLNFLAMAGFNAKQSIAALPGVVDLATAADVELARATDIASDALGAFGLMTKDTEQLTVNLARVNDVFAKTVTSTNTDLEGLFETMKESGAAVRTAGGDIETFGALLTGMAASGVKASKAGTTLKNMYLRLAAPPAEAAKALAKLKVETQDSEGNLRDMLDILEDVRVATDKMGTGQRAAARNAIFGKIAFAGAVSVMDLGKETLDGYRESLKLAGGASRDMANTMRESVQNRMAAIKSSVIEVGLKFADAFKKEIPGFMDSTVKAIRKIDVKEVLKSLRAFWGFLKNVKATLEDLSPLIMGVVAAMVAYKTALIAITVVQAVQMFLKMATAIKTAAAAQGLLNLAMSTNPLMLIVTAIGAVVAAGVLIYKNWDLIKEAAKEVWGFVWNILKSLGEAFKATFGPIWDWFSDFLDNPFFAALATIFLPLITVPALIIKHWEPVKAFFLDLWDSIQPIIEGIKGFALEFGDALNYLFNVAPEAERANKKVRAEHSAFEKDRAALTPPNAAREDSRRQQNQQNVDVSGKMTFENPPAGMSFESDFFGAPKVEKEKLGYN